MLDQARSKEWLLNRVGGGVGKEKTTVACTMRRERQGIDHMRLLWSTNHPYELTRDRLCTVLFVHVSTGLCA